MRLWVDSAELPEIREWAGLSWIEGVTTNPTLFRAAGVTSPLEHARQLVGATSKPVCIDGPPHRIIPLGPNVIPKILRSEWTRPGRKDQRPVNITAVCSLDQFPIPSLYPTDIVSVFAGRIMDTGRDPRPVIDAAKATGAQVLWASVREPYNIEQARAAGCDIVTVTPAILSKYVDWHDKPLAQVAEETIAMFQGDAEGMPWT